MSDPTNPQTVPQHGFSGGSAYDDRDEDGFVFDTMPRGKLILPASPILRLIRATLIIGVFFCGWALLRIGQINLTLSDLMLSVVFAAMLYRGEINIKPFGDLTLFWLLGLGAMLLGLLIGTVINGSVDRWLVAGAQYLFAFMLIPMLLTGQQHSLTRMLPALFVLGISVSQLIGISASLLFEHGDTKDLLGSGFITGNGRLGAMTGEPNPNGAMIAFSIPMLLYSVRRRIMPLGLGLLCGVLLVWGLLASGSFTGFSATLVALAVYLAVSGIGLLIRVAFLAVIGAALFLAAGLPLPAAFEDRVAGALTTGDLNEAGTFAGRSELIDEAWEMVDDNSLIGLGVDQYRVISSHGAPVHEFHLLIWNEGGLLGFAGVVILLLTMFAAAFSAISRSRFEGAMIFAVVVVFNVYAFSVPHMYSRVWILPVLLAMATYFARRDVSEASPSQAMPYR
ncbi:O-antigen ligase family protein [Aurantiacibacter hainanensis]|uniref:O-antigen ligase family protein n=1 Tax=Aurantiacibacter hainanensis TaxID=3076114 RepID=UPI0030C77648